MKPAIFIEDGAVLLTEARKALAAPLRFGDQKQIEARQFIEDVDYFFAHVSKCSACLNGDLCLTCMEMDAERDSYGAVLAAFAMVNERGGVQGIAEAALLAGETHL